MRDGVGTQVPSGEDMTKGLMKKEIEANMQGNEKKKGSVEGNQARLPDTAERELENGMQISEGRQTWAQNFNDDEQETTNEHGAYSVSCTSKTKSDMGKREIFHGGKMRQDEGTLTGVGKTKIGKDDRSKGEPEGRKMSRISQRPRKKRRQEEAND